MEAVLLYEEHQYNLRQDRRIIAIGGANLIHSLKNCL